MAPRNYSVFSYDPPTAKNVVVDLMNGMNSKDVVEGEKVGHYHKRGVQGQGGDLEAEDIGITPVGTITETLLQNALAQIEGLISLGRIHVPVRQTVLNGVTDPVVGIAAFLTVGTGLAVNLAASSTPLIIAFAYNFNKYFGQVDFVESIDEDKPAYWSGLPANQTCYLYIDRDISSGELSPGYSLLAPTYQTLPPDSPLTDRHWFDLNSFYMKRWNGTVWENKQRVFVGKCVTDASSVTSIVCYALRGEFDSGEFNITVNTSYTKTPNLGCGIAQTEIDGYIQSNGQYRKINNVGRASESIATGQRGGDIVWQDSNDIKIRISPQKIHPSVGSGITDQVPNDATTGTARVFAKRRF